MMIKVKALTPGFSGQYRERGEVFEIDEKFLPSSWLVAVYTPPPVHSVPFETLEPEITQAPEIFQEPAAVPVAEQTSQPEEKLQEESHEG